MIGKNLRRIVRVGLSQLPFAIRYELFYQTARSLGVKSYEASGAYGNFFGPLYDQTVIKSYLRSREYSTYIVSMLQQFFVRSGGGTFYDIGANIGLVTVPLSRDPRIACTAYEPDAENFRLLRANVSSNCPHCNVTVVNAAVYSECAMLNFERSEYNSGDHRISGSGNGEWVKAVALDSTAPVVGPLAIKIDTQGAEPAVFAGGKRTFKSADLVVAEFWPWGSARMGMDPSAMIDDLPDLFSFGQIIDHDRPGSWLGIDDITTSLGQIVRRGGEYDCVDVALCRNQAHTEPV